jgi:hypothetical protein
MKYFTILVTIIATALIVYNTTMLDFDNLFEGQSVIALITIFSSLCAIVILQVLRLSKQVDRKLKGKDDV